MKQPNSKEIEVAVIEFESVCNQLLRELHEDDAEYSSRLKFIFRDERTVLAFVSGCIVISRYLSEFDPEKGKRWRLAISDVIAIWTAWNLTGKTP